MVIGLVRSVLRGLLRSPGIEAVYRLRSALPNRASVLRALIGRYPKLRLPELQTLLDLGYAASDAADRMDTMDPEHGFPLDEIPLNEHLGIDPADMTRGRVAIHIDTPGMNFPREGGWNFYVDADMDQTLGEFMDQVKAQAREMIEDEAGYHDKFTLPEDLVIDVTMKWSMRLY